MSRELELAYAEVGLKLQRLNRVRAHPDSTRLDVEEAVLGYRKAWRRVEEIEETL